jgi:hypothetical protein
VKPLLIVLRADIKTVLPTVTVKLIDAGINFGCSGVVNPLSKNNGSVWISVRDKDFEKAKEAIR